MDTGGQDEGRKLSGELMRWLSGLLIDFLALFTGRAFWFEIAAKDADKRGDKKEAIEFRNAAFRERMK